MHYGEEAVGAPGRFAAPASWQAGYKKWAANRGTWFIISLSSRISRFLTEHIERKDSSDSKLQIEAICSVQILNILEVTAKMNFSKIFSKNIFEKLHMINDKNRDKKRPKLRSSPSISRSTVSPRTRAAGFHHSIPSLNKLRSISPLSDNTPLFITELPRFLSVVNKQIKFPIYKTETLFHEILVC